MEMIYCFLPINKQISTLKFPKNPQLADFQLLLIYTFRTLLYIFMEYPAQQTFNITAGIQVLITFIISEMHAIDYNFL